MITANSNSTNVISLFKNEDMAKSLNVGQFTIGDYHMGRVGSEWMVWNEKFHKVFRLPESKKPDDFDAAKKKAYSEILKHCKEKNLPPPPPLQ